MIVRKIAFIFYVLSPFLQFDTQTGLYCNTLSGKQLALSPSSGDEISSETGLPVDFEKCLHDVIQHRSAVLDHALLSSRLRLKEGGSSQKSEH